MKRKRATYLLTSAIAAALLSTQAAGAKPAPHAPTHAPGKPHGAAAQALSEADKIQLLIGSIEQLQGAVFIRNGTEHDAAKAAEHLRRKLDYAGKRVKSADQFIKYLGTGSSMTGKPYKIRFADGRMVDSAAYFREQLRQLESPVRKTAQG